METITPTSNFASDADRLTDGERDALLADLDRDGYVVLPRLLPQSLITDCIGAIDRITQQKRGDNAKQSVKVMNCVDEDPAFIRLMDYEPALQMAYDVFGPMFHLCQSNFVSRPNDGKTQADFVSSSPWHADGPRPNLFPKVNGAMGLHYLEIRLLFNRLDAWQRRPAPSCARFAQAARIGRQKTQRLFGGRLRRRSSNLQLPGRNRGCVSSGAVARRPAQ